MTDSVRCDVVLPYTGHTLRYLGSSLDSILNQQLADCIVHLIADAVDPAADEPVLRPYRGNPNLRLYRNDRQLGPHHCVHRVFDYLETEYFAIQDSDDISLPHRIWHSLTELRHHGCDVFGAAMENFIDWESRDDVTLERYIQRNGTIMRSGKRATASPSGFLLHGTMVIRRTTFERLNGYNEWFSGCDMEFIERAYRAGIPVRVSDAVVGLRRLHAHNVSLSKRFKEPSPYSQRIQDERETMFRQFDSTVDYGGFGCLDKRHRLQAASDRNAPDY